MRGKDHHVACPQRDDYVPFCVKKEDIYGHMVWVDEYGDYKILYYFVPSLQDYNSIEIELKKRRVSGFEWD